MLYLKCCRYPSVQKHICRIGERELTQLLGANVSIGSVNISPFNKLAANDVTVEVGNPATRHCEQSVWCRYNAWQSLF